MTLPARCWWVPGCSPGPFGWIGRGIKALSTLGVRCRSPASFRPPSLLERGCQMNDLDIYEYLYREDLRKQLPDRPDSLDVSLDGHCPGLNPDDPLGR
jgi:hypothetical protein